MKPQAIAALSIVGFAAVTSAFVGPTAYRNSANGIQSSYSTPVVVSKDSAVEAMKKCASDALVARQRWFFDETGITTTKYSGAAQRYANMMSAQGLKTKTPIPIANCSA